jgi:hypothetical protein
MMQNIAAPVPTAPAGEKTIEAIKAKKAKTTNKKTINAFIRIMPIMIAKNNLNKPVISSMV